MLPVWTIILCVSLAIRIVPAPTWLSAFYTPLTYRLMIRLKMTGHLIIWKHKNKISHDFSLIKQSVNGCRQSLLFAFSLLLIAGFLLQPKTRQIRILENEYPIDSICGNKIGKCHKLPYYIKHAVKKNISVVTEVEFSNSFHCLCALDLQKQLGVLNFTFLVKAFMLLLNCTQFIH